MIATTCLKKSRFTAVVSCLADGTKLPPVVIFKKTDLPKNVKFASGFHDRVQLNDWEDDVKLQRKCKLKARYFTDEK